LPGDPAAYFAGPAANKGIDRADPRLVGLDKPADRSDFGRYVNEPRTRPIVSANSLTTGQPVVTEIKKPASGPRPELTLVRP